MKTIVSELVCRLGNEHLELAELVNWGSPIISFGDPTVSRFATIGINPSNLEFVDANGHELGGLQRRFHTLDSLGLSSWSEIKPLDIDKILDACVTYFYRNPYEGWFNKLEAVISQSGSSYYSARNSACHLDLIPFATTVKWGDIGAERRKLLIRLSGDSLGTILKASPVETILLNGTAVVNMLGRMSDLDVSPSFETKLDLGQEGTSHVKGRTYLGNVGCINGIQLGRTIKVIGYNHNVQSSFGVTSRLIQELARWVGDQVEIRR